MKKVAVFALALLLLAVSVMPALSAADEGTIVDIIVASAGANENPQFTKLLAAVQAAGLESALIGDGQTPVTLFAPTDAAFDALGADNLAKLLADKALLTKVLTYHVVPGNFTAAKLKSSNAQKTLEGENIAVSTLYTQERRDGVLILNNTATVITEDMKASNGVIQVIDQVLMPSYEIAGDDLYLAVNDSPIYAVPGEQTIAGRVMKGCQTGYVTAYSRGYYQVREMGGWVNALQLMNVAENYAQPGGQPIIDQCIGK